MTRRFVCVSLMALLCGCSGAGVSSTDLRGKVAAEVAQVVVNREQLAPLIGVASVDEAALGESIALTRGKAAAAHAAQFEVLELHDLRRFYSSREGQTLVALAYAEEGGGTKPPLSAKMFEQVELSLRDPLIARSVGVLREVLRAAFQSEFAFG